MYFKFLSQQWICFADVRQNHLPMSSLNLFYLLRFDSVVSLRCMARNYKSKYKKTSKYKKNKDATFRSAVVGKDITFYFRYQQLLVYLQESFGC